MRRSYAEAVPIPLPCGCTADLTVRLHDGGERYPVIPVDGLHTEVSYWYDARCTGCDAKYGSPFARVDEAGQVLANQRDGLPFADRMWFADQCGPFTCGCDQEKLAAD
jgi:hypothetical protein